jgi:hypothetical protein
MLSLQGDPTGLEKAVQDGRSGYLGELMGAEVDTD